MAGVKITDLGTLTTAVDADLLYIVDVSDTSQSPEGTSKQIELGNILSSGTWSPTFSAETGAASNPTFTKAQYSRVGNIVTCTIYGGVDLDFTSILNGSFSFDYPFAPSSTNSIGTCGIRGANGQISSYIKNNNIYFESDNTFAFGGLEFAAIFQYEIN